MQDLKETEDSAISAELLKLTKRRISQRSKDIYCAYRTGCTYPQIAEYFGISNREIVAHLARGLLAIMGGEWVPLLPQNDGPPRIDLIQKEG